jgi:hypothetical protein
LRNDDVAGEEEGGDEADPGVAGSRRPELRFARDRIAGEEEEGDGGSAALPLLVARGGG